ncbi:MAG: ABC transporter substrate-binding protein [Candidatus Promineifilaceae bacterium]
MAWLIVLITAVSTNCTNNIPACTDPLGCIELRTNDPIEIATLLAESGDAAPLGLDAAAGAELALQAHNNEFLGHPLMLNRENSACLRTQAQTAVTRIISNPKTIAIIGPTCAATAELILPVVNGVGLTLISPSVTSQETTAAAATLPPAFYRTIPASSTQGQIAAQYTREQLNLRRAAIIGSSSSISTQQANAFAQTFVNLDGRIVFHGTLSPDQQNFSELFAAITVGQPDVLFLPLFAPEANTFLNQLANELGLENLTLIGPDTLFTPQFAESTGPAAETMYLVAPAIVGETYQQFLTTWQERFNSPPLHPYHVFAYDAVNMLLEAVKLSAEVGNDGSLLIGRQALRDALVQTNMAGLSGPVVCQPNGECGTAVSLGVYQLSNAEINGRRWPPLLVWKP